MVSKTFYRQPKRRQAGFLLLEAAIAIGFAAASLAIYTSILQKQNDMAKRARDIDMIEMLINQEINTYRHYSRFWRTTSGYTKTVDTDSNITTYQPSASLGCFSWRAKGTLEIAYRSDSGIYANTVPGTNRLGNLSNSPAGFQVPGYNITRSISQPSVNNNSASSTYEPPESSTYTYRINYTVKTSTSQTLLERNFDIQIPAQFHC